MNSGGGEAYDLPPRSRASQGEISDGTSGGTIEPASSDPCDLWFSALLQSPHADAIGELSFGSVLDIVVVSDPTGPRIAEARTPDGDTVGTITTNLADLLACTEGGNRYEAVVVTIDGGAIKVKVRRVPTADLLSYAATLENVDPIALTEVVEGSRLALSLGNSDPEGVIATLNDGRRVGDIIRHLPQLVPYLSQGEQFEAIARIISDGIEVRISPTS